MLHRDDDVYPLPRPHAEVVVNTMWALDDFTVENGATRVVPGSHRWEAGRARHEDGDDGGRDARGLGAVLRRQPAARRRRQPHRPARASA